MMTPKERHGCFTIWLVFAIIRNAVTLFAYLSGGEATRESLSAFPPWSQYAAFALTVVNLLCIIGLLRWKKWAFWGLVSTSVASLLMNLSIGVDISTALRDPILIVILYGILHIGDHNKGWPQLD